MRQNDKAVEMEGLSDRPEQDSELCAHIRSATPGTQTRTRGAL